MAISVSTRERTIEEVYTLAKEFETKFHEFEEIVQALFLKTRETAEELDRNCLQELVDEGKFSRKVTSISSRALSHLTKKMSAQEDFVNWIDDIGIPSEILMKELPSIRQSACKSCSDLEFAKKHIISSPTDKAKFFERLIKKVEENLTIIRGTLEILEEGKKNSETQLLLIQANHKAQIKKVEQVEKKARFFKVLAMVSWLFSTFFGATVIANCTSLILDCFQNRAFPRERLLNVFIKNLLPSTKQAAIPVIMGTIGYMFLENPSLQRRTIDVFRHALEKLLSRDLRITPDIREK